MQRKTGGLKIGIMCHAGCGGSSRLAIQLSSELVSRRHLVHLFTLSFPFWRNAVESGVKLHFIQKNKQRGARIFLRGLDSSRDQGFSVMRFKGRSFGKT